MGILGLREVHWIPVLHEKRKKYELDIRNKFACLLQVGIMMAEPFGDDDCDINVKGLTKGMRAQYLAWF